MSLKKLRQLRRQAFEKQNHLCYYCKLPMWEQDQQQFARGQGVPARLVKYGRCTAEHLVARKDGGRDLPENIVAACLWCNASRHRGRQHCAPDPTAYKTRVSQLVGQGIWHPVIASKLARALT
ncbi:HNH endonuclease [Janthinobacterium sp. 17J80-10]|uniref:HNH endonuclease n=1 Tax=Janthinobacterium sp. 17J80-10 TaxID=2497863 RepID=UPI0010053849|nr:HNH endonuclease [Janthinobacterium sp. 17J80-10]QAU34913.1 restriction endonuclease [Janthinobacterium sp. 17J80-10]